MKRIILFVSLLAACTQEKVVEYNAQRVVDEVTDMLNQYHDAMRIGGLEAEFDYLDQSDEFFWIPPGFDQAIDYDSVATILRATDQTLQSIVLEWDTLKVNPINDSLAQYYGRLTSTTIDTAGTEYVALLVESGLIC